MQPSMIALMNNAALLLVLSVIYQLTNFINKKYTRIKQIVNGLLIALVCIAIMSMPYTLYPGVVFDTRSILISVTALVFGPIPTIITMIAAIVFRILQGGTGAMPGVAVNIFSAVIGSVWRLWIHSRATKLRWLNVYGMSLLVHIVMIACMSLLPYPANVNVIHVITLPVLLIYPVASVLLYLLLTQLQKYFRVQDQLSSLKSVFDCCLITPRLGISFWTLTGI
ncbi:MAG: hypothetical protein GX488_03110 [Clostridiales bacterium]|nr:hypothetical protein [Clostridiales bacterium]